MQSIVDQFICDPKCPICKGTGHVCENHPSKAWGELHKDGCNCGGAGMPCPSIAVGRVIKAAEHFVKIAAEFYPEYPEAVGEAMQTLSDALDATGD